MLSVPSFVSVVYCMYVEQFLLGGVVTYREQNKMPSQLKTDEFEGLIDQLTRRERGRKGICAVRPWRTLISR